MNSFLKRLSRIRPYVRYSSGLRLSLFQYQTVSCGFDSFLGKEAAQFSTKLKTAGLSQCRPFSSKHSRKTFYQILGVSPKSTQAQIKAAYYELSKKHHPDRQKGSQKAHGRFQEISEAYTVLGSLDSRKQYDRSLIIEGSLAPENARPFHKPPKRSSTIYNFDEWTEKHYYDSLLREQNYKRSRRYKEEEMIKEPPVPPGSFRLMCIVVFSVILIAGYFILEFKEQSANEELENYNE